jgi:AcrR family transcriptional regulator
MPKSSDQSTRDRILRAAVEEIAEVGWQGARTRSIAGRAGVNNALVHYHFSTMEDLLLEAAATAFAHLAEGAAASIQAHDLGSGLRSMVEMVATLDPAEPESQVLLEAMVMTSRVPRLAEMTHGLLTEYRAAMEARLDAAVTDGLLPADTDTHGLAWALMALFDGLGLYSFVDPGIDVRRAGNAIVTLFTHQGDTP